MRNVALADVDAVDRPVLAIGTDYPPHYLLKFHRHRRAQFLYAATGIMLVDTAGASWTVPTHRAVLIPPGVDHQVLMDDVSTRSLYIEPLAVPWFPNRCQVVDVAPLLRALLLAAVELPAEYDRHGRDGALVELILHEIQSLTALPFELPMPHRDDLRGQCQRFASAPSIQEIPTQWAKALGVSTRTFNRIFRAETGLTFQQWRQRACVRHAIRLLATGSTVTQVAATLGYDTPAAFSTMFTKSVGTAPKSFRRW
ncbi:AraC family transcriptional regulator [Mycobacterium bourgelatii]|uniref:HTH-type transcriptional regulator RipA n=1 Tax=Mycobacterium bourgelatii TaxID=1273442 RepID=A0A7I9YQ39_MYCBU|nr:helix-turn-helix transcriptional regulator [Mycobacterium bourgelatii]MCV6972905.1 helix-turn-helix transcriptional regulator [Mycobacterium bourgelatii]GFG90738.1 transcriptional regulator [Mycobacterium bourgelatii]